MLHICKAYYHKEAKVEGEGGMETKLVNYAIEWSKSIL